MAAFVLILVLTLNLNAALLSLLLIIAIVIFQNSFSRGWLFLFALIALIPATKVGAGSVSIHEVLLTILALVGLVHIVIGDIKVKPTKLYFLFFLLILIGASIWFFGHFFKLSISTEITIITTLFVLLLTTMISFQHFFQTKKRIKMFFVLLVSIGFAHSLFGIMSLALGWQSPTGMGITAGTFQLFSDNLIQHQINGFLGNGYILKVGENALAPFLLISIPLNIGLLISSKKMPERSFDKVHVPSFQLFDSIHTAAQKKYWIGILENSSRATLYEKLRKFFTTKILLIFTMSIQIIGLALTFSYVSLVIFSIGIFVIAVLLRKKSLISTSIVILILLALIIPSFFSSITVQSEQNISQWLTGLNQIKSGWFWGNGWRIEKSDILDGQRQIYNSFLLTWNTFGLIGLSVLIGMLTQYFRQLRSAYLTSDGTSRIWLIVIISIFVEFVFLAMTSNSFFFGPAAIIFWLLYAVGFNLQKKTVVFGLTETRLRFE